MLVQGLGGNEPRSIIGVGDIKNLRLGKVWPLPLFSLLISMSLAAPSCAESIVLRQGYSYFFGNSFSAGNLDAGLTNLRVEFTEKGNFNRGGNPKFPWTGDIISEGYVVKSGGDMSISRSDVRYQVIDHPINRKQDNIVIKYFVKYKEKSGETWGPELEAVSIQNYEISWCGDGVRDDYIDSYNSVQISEACDPNDEMKEGWVNGECPVTCGVE
jgi:hypothetical protein